MTDIEIPDGYVVDEMLCCSCIRKPGMWLDDCIFHLAPHAFNPPYRCPRCHSDHVVIYIHAEEKKMPEKERSITPLMCLLFIFVLMFMIVGLSLKIDGLRKDIADLSQQVKSIAPDTEHE